MFGFGTSDWATVALILLAPIGVCALLYVLARLEPPLRRTMWLVDGEPALAPQPHERAGAESAA